MHAISGAGSGLASMQLREILDLEAMLSKGPAPEALTDEDEGADGEISEKTAGPSYKEEEDVAEESSDDEDEDGLIERRHVARRSLGRLAARIVEDYAEADLVPVLDEPLPRQYVRYLGQLLHGQFGPSFQYRNTSVNELIAQGLPIDATIGGLALLIALYMSARDGKRVNLPLHY